MSNEISTPESQDVSEAKPIPHPIQLHGEKSVYKWIASGAFIVLITGVGYMATQFNQRMDRSEEKHEQHLQKLTALTERMSTQTGLGTKLEGIAEENSDKIDLMPHVLDKHLVSEDSRVGDKMRSMELRLKGLQSQLEELNTLNLEEVKVNANEFVADLEEMTKSVAELHNVLKDAERDISEFRKTTENIIQDIESNTTNVAGIDKKLETSGLLDHSIPDLVKKVDTIYKYEPHLQNNYGPYTEATDSNIDE